MRHPRFRGIFVDTLRQLREETGFLLAGWVLMPDHFHLLIRRLAQSELSSATHVCLRRLAQGERSPAILM
jgi:REP element-mobilizing transposase RayT